MIKKIDAIMFQCAIRPLKVKQVEIIVGCSHLNALRIISTLKVNGKITVTHNTKGELTFKAKK